ncbi:hypothetical protein [Mycobacterium sp. ACS4331]|uniref:hypothetical protein n=1 Tax=Mycobacterium sp. ACS4331 TaxID=1834121 RepID=UPI0007FC9D4F|nr:hypothetical protein [Mycobacterium sp. ACS4331]OBF16208.1 hypothetical protein A5727_13985 [Mycobacterium sp. ACS4331]
MSLRLVVATFGLTVALSGAIVGCSSDSTEATSTTGSASPTAADRQAFTDCMTENGIPAPPEGGPGGPAPDGPPPGAPQGPGGPPPGAPDGPPPAGAPEPGRGTPPSPPDVDRETWDRAIEACASLAPTPSRG